MYLFNNKAAIVKSGRLYSTPDIHDKVKTAKNILEVYDPVAHYGQMLSIILQNRVINLRNSIWIHARQMFYMCMLLLIVKIGWALHTGSQGFMSTLWDETKWTVPLMSVFMLGYIFLKHYGASFSTAIMIREGLLGLSVCYDSLFTKTELRDVLLSCTPPEKRDEMIYNKGYLRSHMEQLIESVGLVALFDPNTVKAIGDLSKTYMDYILEQYNSIDHFDTNYQKSQKPYEKT